MGSDFTNPMAFDVDTMRKQIETGAHCPEGFDPEEVKRWKTVYTCYFNSDYTLA